MAPSTGPGTAATAATQRVPGRGCGGERRQGGGDGGQVSWLPLAGSPLFLFSVTCEMPFFRLGGGAASQPGRDPGRAKM